MKSQGEIEAAVCEGVSRFQQEWIGRGPKDIHCHLLGSLVVVRLQGVLTPAERQILDPPEQAPDGNGNGNGNENGHARPVPSFLHEGGDGRALVKQVRHRVVTNGRSHLNRLIEETVGVKLVSVHHDISTLTGEEMLVFSLSEPPTCRPKRKA